MLCCLGVFCMDMKYSIILSEHLQSFDIFVFENCEDDFD